MNKINSSISFKTIALINRHNLLHVLNIKIAKSMIIRYKIF